MRSKTLRLSGGLITSFLPGIEHQGDFLRYVLIMCDFRWLVSRRGDYFGATVGLNEGVSG